MSIMVEVTEPWPDIAACFWARFGWYAVVLGPLWPSLESKIVIGFAVCAALLAALLAHQFSGIITAERRGSLREEGLRNTSV
jgi:hypothetical protein